MLSGFTTIPVQEVDAAVAGAVPFEGDGGWGAQMEKLGPGRVTPGQS